MVALLKKTPGLQDFIMDLLPDIISILMVMKALKQVWQK
jgi:hypothetical protein